MIKTRNSGLKWAVVAMCAALHGVGGEFVNAAPAAKPAKTLTAAQRLRAVRLQRAAAARAARAQAAARAAQLQNATRAEFRQIYRSIDAAISRRDFDRYWQYAADNFVVISQSGERRTADQIKAETVRLFSYADSIDSRSVIERIVFKPNTALVTVRNNGVVVSRVSETRRTTVKSNDRSVDTWVRYGGRWLIVKSQILSSSLNVDGRNLRQ